MAASAFVANAAADPPYPNRPVRLVTSEIGGSADAGARLMAQGLTPRLGQQVIVDNRPSGVIPSDIVARARPDGYTLLNTGAEAIGSTPEELGAQVKSELARMRW